MSSISTFPFWKDLSKYHRCTKQVFTKIIPSKLLNGHGLLSKKMSNELYMLHLVCSQIDMGVDDYLI
jgi:hypothetical protein